MNLFHYVWQFEGALCNETCDRIIEAGLKSNKQRSLVGEMNLSNKPLTKKEEKFLLKKRVGEVAWLNQPWMYELIQPYIHLANHNAGWNFDWSWTEDIQFTIYRPGEFYEWHTDSWDKQGDNPQDKFRYGKIRKLSSVIQLSDPSTYEGGILELDPRQQNPGVKKRTIITASAKRGTIICFPSFVWHRATKVTKGVRYSIPMWSWGPPFK